MKNFPHRRRPLSPVAAVPLLLLGAASSAGAPPIVEGDLAALQARIRVDRGHPLLINFWATWCVPCIQEMPLLNELQAELSPDGVRMVAVSLDSFVYPERKEAQQKVGRTVRERDFRLPVFLYIGDQDSLTQAYSLPGGLPHTVLLAPDGAVVDRVEGRLEEDEVERLKRKLAAMAEIEGR